jgi:cytochrome oxidase assembly protein ShyY1
LKLGEPLPGLPAVEDRPVEVLGRFDESRQVLLSARERAELPGVEVVTPLLLSDSVAVLVNRGWLYAPDAVHARPQDFRERSPRAVRGVALALGRRGAGLPYSVLESDTSHTLWSARTLDPDTLAVRFPYALAPWVLLELPARGVPEKPLRSPPRPLDEMTNLSYTVQWFAFAAIILVGSVAFAWSKRRVRPRRPVRPPLEPLR